MLRLSVGLTLLFCTAFAGCKSFNQNSTSAMANQMDPQATAGLAADVDRRAAAQNAVTNPPATAGNLPPNSGGGPDALLNQARQAEQQRQLDTARNLYEQVLQQQPQNAEAHHRLAVIADQQGRYSDSLTHYQLALRLTPYDANIHSDLGYSLLLQQRMNESVQSLEYAIQLDPMHQTAHSNLAQAYQRRAEMTGNAQDLQSAQQEIAFVQRMSGTEVASAQEQEPQYDMSHLNPFGGQGGTTPRTAARNPSSLQAPPPNKATQKFLETVEQERQKYLAEKMSRPQRSKPKDYDPFRRGIPPDSVRDAFSRIDEQAELERQQYAASENSYPELGGMMNQMPAYTGDVQQAAAWQAQYQAAQNAQAAQGANNYPGGTSPRINPNGAGSTPLNDPNAIPGLTQSWPLQGPSPTQTLGPGQTWNPQAGYATQPRGNWNGQQPANNNQGYNNSQDASRQAAAAMGLAAGSNAWGEPYNAGPQYPANSSAPNTGSGMQNSGPNGWNNAPHGAQNWNTSPRSQGMNSGININPAMNTAPRGYGGQFSEVQQFEAQMSQGNTAYRNNPQGRTGTRTNSAGMYNSSMNYGR